MPASLAMLARAAYGSLAMMESAADNPEWMNPLARAEAIFPAPKNPSFITEDMGAL